jgi:hypothetical protein
VSLETERQHADGPYSGYAEPEERPPFGTYAVFAGVFNAAFAGALVRAKRSGRELPATVYAPRTTRLVASTFTALTISDFLQIGYKAAEDRGLGGA